MTALQAASFYGHTTIVQWLLGRASSDESSTAAAAGAGPGAGAGAAADTNESAAGDGETAVTLVVRDVTGASHVCAALVMHQDALLGAGGGAGAGRNAVHAACVGGRGLDVVQWLHREFGPSVLLPLSSVRDCGWRWSR